MNKEQKKLLNVFLGKKGLIFAAIERDSSLNSGIKILYLRRAMTQDCHEFNSSLDKLYRSTNIEFIRMLKMINDLYFNNEIKIPKNEVKRALHHFFGLLGDVNIDTFQAIIKNKVLARMTQIQGVMPSAILGEQQENWLKMESTARMSYLWRQELNLPLKQQVVSTSVPVFIAPSTFFRPSISLENIIKLARKINFSTDELLHLFQTNSARYRQISYLYKYIRNFNHGTHPALSLKDVYATTHQELANLATAYPYIKDGIISIQAARDMNESERRILCNHDPSMRVKNIESLATFRAGR